MSVQSVEETKSPSKVITLETKLEIIVYFETANKQSLEKWKLIFYATRKSSLK